MNDHDDKTWQEFAKRIRKSERHIVTGEEADQLLGNLADDALQEDDLEALVEAVSTGRPLGEVRSQRAQGTAADAETLSPGEAKAIQEDVLQLNRNKGEDDEAAQELLDRLRCEALEDDEDEDA